MLESLQSLTIVSNSEKGSQNLSVAKGVLMIKIYKTHPTAGSTNCADVAEEFHVQGSWIGIFVHLLIYYAVYIKFPQKILKPKTQVYWGEN